MVQQSKCLFRSKLTGINHSNKSSKIDYWFHKYTTNYISSILQFIKANKMKCKKFMIASDCYRYYIAISYTAFYYKTLEDEYPLTQKKKCNIRNIFRKTAIPVFLKS